MRCSMGTAFARQKRFPLVSSSILCEGFRKTVWHRGLQDGLWSQAPGSHRDGLVIHSRVPSRWAWPRSCHLALRTHEGTRVQGAWPSTGPVVSPSRKLRLSVTFRALVLS